MCFLLELNYLLKRNMHSSPARKDYFVVTPEKSVPIFSYTPGLGNMKFSTAASGFTNQACLRFLLNWVQLNEFEPN